MTPPLTGLCPSCTQPWDGVTCETCGWSEAKDKRPHRWTSEAASRAGRTGGQATKRPRGLGKPRGSYKRKVE